MISLNVCCLTAHSTPPGLYLAVNRPRMELLALDINLLKSEIGIENLGLRMRIKGAIDKLRPAGE